MNSEVWPRVVLARARTRAGAGFRTLNIPRTASHAVAPKTPTVGPTPPPPDWTNRPLKFTGVHPALKGGHPQAFGRDRHCGRGSGLGRC